MLKQTFSALFLCLCFGAFSCTDKSTGFFGDARNPSNDGETAGNPATEDLASEDLAGVDSQDIAADESVDTVNPNGDPDNPPEPVPEPMTMLLFGSGLASVAYRYRRRKDGKAEGAPAAV
jgi:PEP-CTERM motif